MSLAQASFARYDAVMKADGECTFQAIKEDNEGPFQYRPRDPTNTLLYRTIQENLETFLAGLESNPSAKGMPAYVKDEFYGFLGCGVLANGFIRYRCGACEEELLVAFSCKKRGFCPSCLSRRMAEVAAHLVDHVIPSENVRQWVVTLPIPLRYWCASSKDLTAAVNKIAVREIAHYYRKKAKEAGFEGKLHPGLITFVQRFGSSLNLNVHFHILALDGVYLDRSDQGLTPRFTPIKGPLDGEVEAVVARIAKKTIKKLRKLTYLDDATEEPIATGQDPLFEEEPEHSKAMAASVKSRIAFGPRRGQKVRTIRHLIHRAFGYEEDEPKTTKPRCSTVNGFSLHADVLIKKHRRQALERLIRYMARGPFSHDRLSEENGGDLRYQLKTPWQDGTVAIKLSPLELLEKLSALVPLPRFNLFRYAGIFAPNHKLRPLVIPTPDAPASDENDELPKAFRLKWHELLKRVFGIDIDTCPWCGEKAMKFVSVIQEAEVISKFLAAVGKPTRAPPIKPAQAGQAEFDW